VPLRAAASSIAVLFHEKSRDDWLPGYIVHHLARFWREDGHEVAYVFGTRRFVPADLVLVHVDLSVVPAPYLDFAAQYPMALNRSVGDIRKSVVSTNLVGPGDPWKGPVMVKSDLNCGGWSEDALVGWLPRSRVRRRARRTYERLARRQTFRSSTDYRVYDDLSSVPAALTRRRDLVLEKFLPEREDGLYHLRVYQFLGNRSSCVRLASHDPVVKAGTSVSAEAVEPHPEILAWRERLGMDYGKLDYVVRDGHVVLIDVNKTTGASKHMDGDALDAMRRELAEGLYAYFG
jgi:hypothetical protein